MSIYSAPARYPSIFNPWLFNSTKSSSSSSSSSGGGVSLSDLTLAQANALYAKLAGNETIVGKETFTGGILTNNIGLQSGIELTVTADRLQVTGDIRSSADIEAGQTIYADQLNVTSTASIPTLTLTSGLIQGSFTTLFSAFGAAATTHTITSTQLSWLANNNWSGELKLFVDDGSTNAGISILYLAKPSTTLFVTQGSKATSMGKFETTNTNTQLTVTLTNSCRLAWIFIGAT